MVNEENIEYNMPMMSFLEKYSVMKDSDICIQYYGRAITYRELKDNIRIVARNLEKKGFVKGDRIAVSLVTFPETAFLIFAAGMLGLEIFCVDVRNTDKLLRECCRSLSPKAFFYGDWDNRFVRRVAPEFENIEFVCVSPVECGAPLIREIRHLGFYIASRQYFRNPGNIIYWHKYISDRSLSHGYDNENINKDINGKGHIIFPTSGSTGQQKYAVFDNEKLNMDVYQHIKCGFIPDDVDSILSVLPAFTCTGWITSVFLPLLIGKKAYFHPVFKNEHVWNAVKKNRINMVIGTVALFENMIISNKLKNTDLSFIKEVFSGGDRVDSILQNKINGFLSEHGSKGKCIQGYGMTELCSGAVVQNTDNYYPGMAGEAMPLTEIRIGEACENSIPENSDFENSSSENSNSENSNSENNNSENSNSENSNSENSNSLKYRVGEILVRTPVQMEGYYIPGEGIRNTADKDGWIHTGDIGYLDENGQLCFVSRKSRIFVQMNGTKIYLDDIEKTICGLKWIERCACIGGSQHHNSNGLILFIVPKSGYTKNEAVRKTKKFINDNFNPQEIPDKIKAVGTMPLTSSRKTDYRRLTEMCI